MKKNNKPTIFVKSGAIDVSNLTKLNKRFFVIVVNDVSDIREVH